jgi:hypothetical protein
VVANPCLDTRHGLIRATNDIPSAADFNELHADPLQADVAAAQSTTSTGYTDLSTAGPAQTKTLVNGQKVWVEVSGEIWGAGAGVEVGRMSFAVSGATTLAASDTNAASNRLTSNVISMCSRATVFTATASGSHTFTAKYRTTNAAVAANFESRRIVIKPF